MEEPVDTNSAHSTNWAEGRGRKAETKDAGDMKKAGDDPKAIPGHPTSGRLNSREK
jgi:hypothetical protein